MNTARKVALATAALLCAWLVWRQLAPDNRAGELELEGRAQPERPPIAPLEQDPTGKNGRTALEAVATAKLVGESPSLNPQPATSDLQASLNITFFREDVPAPGIPVWLFETASGKVKTLDLLDVHFALPSEAPREATNAAGIAAFHDLRPGRYFVGFDPNSSAAKPSSFATIELHTAHPYEIHLGSARVHGRVFDDLGRAQPGVGVMASMTNPDPKSKFVWMVRGATQSQGEYSFGDLPALPYVVVMDPDGRFDGRGEIQQRAIELHAEENRELDFGSAMLGPRWSGRLLNAFEEPFPGIARLQITSTKAGTQITAAVDISGSFKFAFTPGTWQVIAFAAGSSDAGFDLGSIDLPETDLLRDLIVPGVRVQGRVLAVQAGQALPEELEVIVHPKGQDYPAAFRTVNATKEGNYVIDGLEPGVWVFSVWPGALSTSTEVIVSASQRGLDQDLRWASQ